jgi:predicted TIM-barrel enzyme
MVVARSEILKGLYAKAATGTPIIGGGAGAGISAKCEEAAGIDLIVVYNSGRYRMAGRVSITGLFAYGDANAIVMEMAGEVLPVVKNTPVIAGVNATDPFRSMPRFLREVEEAGFSGVQNFPTVGLFDGIMRANMEACGLGYDRGAHRAYDWWNYRSGDRHVARGGGRPHEPDRSCGARG